MLFLLDQIIYLYIKVTEGEALLPEEQPIWDAWVATRKQRFTWDELLVILEEDAAMHRFLRENGEKIFKRTMELIKRSE